jgi:hypothetical protein
MVMGTCSTIVFEESRLSVLISEILNRLTRLFSARIKFSQFDRLISRDIILSIKMNLKSPE